MFGKGAIEKPKQKDFIEVTFWMLNCIQLIVYDMIYCGNNSETCFQVIIIYDSLFLYKPTNHSPIDYRVPVSFFANCIRTTIYYILTV